MKNGKSEQRERGPMPNAAVAIDGSTKYRVSEIFPVDFIPKFLQKNRDENNEKFRNPWQ